MPLSSTRKIIQIAVSAAPGNVPVGLEVGELGVDLANPPRLWIGCPPGIDVSELLRLPLASYAASVAWTTSTDPHNTSFFTNNTGRTLVIVRISGVVEVQNAAGGTSVKVVKANTGDTLTGVNALDVHLTPGFDASGTPGVVQNVTPTPGMTLEPGWRLGLITGGTWSASVASMTVYLE